jgi:AcrR family transcriptional regulator
MATQTKVNPNDPRVKRTRQMLKRALGELLAEKAFHDVSVQDIAERATLNRATFYAHFEDKYDLAGSWVRDDFVHRLHASVPRSLPVTVENLRLLCMVVLQTLRDTHEQCRPIDSQYVPLFESVVQEALYGFILEWFRLSMSQQSGQEMKVEPLARVMSWTIFGAGIDWSRVGDAAALDSFVEEIVEVLLRGVSEMLAESAVLAEAQA